MGYILFGFGLLCAVAGLIYAVSDDQRNKINEENRLKAEAKGKEFNNPITKGFAFGMMCFGVVMLLIGMAIIPGGEDTQPEKKQEAAAEKAYVPDSECKKTISCWADRHWAMASSYCTSAVEKLAQYDYEWTDGLLGMKFTRNMWQDKEQLVVAYGGDSIKFQNGFGAFQNHKYICIYDTVNQYVVDAGAEPGRY